MQEDLEVAETSFTLANPARAETGVILFLDMVAYSYQIELDEAATLDFMGECFDVIRNLALRYNGELVKTIGDGAFLLFVSAVQAIGFGVDFHRIVAKLQTGAADPFRFRIGIHLGKIVRRNGDVFGNAVNIAARLQSEAAPGTCLISTQVRDEVGDRSDFVYQSIGVRRLKNITERIHLFRVIDPTTTSAPTGSPALPILQTIGDLTFSEPQRSARLSGIDGAAGLVGYLALCPGQSETVDRLVALLWPGSGPTHGRIELERSIAALIQALPAPFDVILTGADWVSLDKIRFNTDLELIEVDLRGGRVPWLLTGVPDWPERILAGTDAFSAEFRTWRTIQRKSWLLRILRALEGILERVSADKAAFGDAADAILLLEPGNEVASLARITHNLSQGRRRAALDEFARLKSYLTKTFGAEPDPTILARIQEALAGEAPSAGQRPQIPCDGPRMLRIVVAGFEAGVGADHNRVGSFRSDLIANLARFRDWSVHDTGQSTGARLPQPGVQVDYRIEGRAVPSSAGLMLELSLQTAANGRTLWSERLSLGTDTWDEEQQRAIRGTTSRLERYISSDRLATVLRAAPTNQTNHDKWLLGDQAMMRWTPDGVEEARRIFKEILLADPDHVPSLTSLASISNIQHIVHPGLRRTVSAAAEADHLARRAAALDPLDSRVQRAVAWTAAINDAFERALLHMDRAAELNPNSPATQASCAMGYAWFGDRDKADATLTRLQSLSTDFAPWIWSYAASAQFFLGRYGDALRSAELSDDGIIDNQGWVAAIHAALGNEAASGRAFGRLVAQVTPVWAGPTPATAEAVRDWFCTAFPIRREADREVLERAMTVAAGSVAA